MAAVVQRAGGRPGPCRGRPAALIAHTVKGKGVSFMEGNFRWHSRVPTEEELATALRRAGRARCAQPRRRVMTMLAGKALRAVFGETIAELGDTLTRAL